MVVFEDIDSMTDIVRRRDIRFLQKAQIVSENDDLNLAYLLNMLDGTLTPSNSVIVMTTNHKEHLDPALIRSGRVDIHVEMKRCDHYLINCIYKKFMKRELTDTIIKRIPEDKYVPADIIFHLVTQLFSGASDEEIMSKFYENDKTNIKTDCIPSAESNNNAIISVN